MSDHPASIANPTTANPTTKPTAAIFSGRLLPASETFIRAQAEGLTQFEPLYVGARRVAGLTLPADRTIVVNQGGLKGKGQEYLFKRLGFSPQLNRQLQRSHPTLIHAHFGVCGTLALPLARALQRPLLVTFHGFDACMSDAYAKQDSLSTQVYLHRRDALKKEAHTFIAVSHFIKNKLIERGFPSDKIRVHYIGIDTQQFSPDPAINREQIVLFVGRLTEKKGCEHLIRAMASVQQKLPQAQLVVIGDGVLRQSLEALAASTLKQYRFLGVQPSSVVREWMNRARIFAVPSVVAKSGDAEGFGMVFAEAQAMNLPVVSFATGGIPEAVAHEKTGFLAPAGDWRSLAQYILQLFQNPQLWKQMSHAGRKHIQTNFNLTAQTKTLEKIYTSVQQSCAS